MKLLNVQKISPLVAVLALSGCASLMPPAQVESTVAATWQAPLPHQGQLSDLTQWWQQQGDPVLVELIAAAQTVSPTMSMAVARIEAARANQALARSALLPNVNAQVSASRGVSQPNVPVANSSVAAIAASWEVDLVGANRAVSNAALANLQGTQAQWHDARVSVSAEVAALYYSLDHCKRQLALAQRDAASRAETARLTEINAKAGFLAPSIAAMARASAADGNSRVTSQGAQCDIQTKSLVALTAIPEPELRAKLASGAVDSAGAATISVASVPAQTLTQRPDVFAAERDVVVASAQVGSAKAQRLPRLSLNGSIGALRLSSGGVEQDVSTWSFGPLAVSLPLFDGGQRVAAVQSAQAGYETAVVTYRAKVRNAVREVEEALVNLQSTEARARDAKVATQGYADSLAATQSRFGQGLASLVELEDARRNALASESAEMGLRLERKLAWITLYRALGGGFERPQ
ncbi:MAG: RND transporter [Burkholderiales bacterium PBB4]|nr:MAG: RND transporter [Burkholderiales bacterium PBB4]